ncbi:enoyl-ACP reductase FabV [Acidihalobacter ferrooxydans]|uniref:Enoyl-[acyl-carrier-protein] reductase [NADH] n=1 Tax=Acidihalobacter ferrooxydans TaxID=1765967 RepID=A0A1P8UHB5_9GAMM|nr:enoyl-ACP reductase FabV [Acidihalobacter ferrooxydans]APZ43217.1 trans-2-enoyl-CoA reductase [Acidihalobacter ferrooxydans]
MIIEPKIRGFICTTAHPTGCAAHVREQIDYVKQHPLSDGPKRVLIIGSSSGYGLASRITAAFGAGAATLGVFFERPGTEKKTGTAGWYNAAAFERFAHDAGLYAKSLNGDAFSAEAKAKTIDLIKADLGQIDLVIYSLASPVRKMPDTGEIVRSALKPIGAPFRAHAIDTNRDTVMEAEIEPATEAEIQATIKVMGGQDWELWMSALSEAGVLADGCQSTAYSYIGTDITWPIYWHGALGRAKQDLDRAAHAINAQLSEKGGRACVSMLKSVVTQASAAIPMMPLYLSIVMKVMKDGGLHEGCIEQIDRLFLTGLYGSGAVTDEDARLRMDDWELREDIQERCRALWPQVTSDNVFESTDYASYKAEFLKLFGFGFSGVDYTAEVSPEVAFNVIDI